MVTDNNNNMLFFSICIPTYNNADRITLLINKYKPYLNDKVEMVITDDSKESMFVKEEYCIHYFHNIKRYGYENMIHALLNGNGKYVALAGDKDFIDNVPELFKDLQALDEDKDLALVVCNYNDKKGEKLTNINSSCIQSLYKSNTVNKALFTMNSTLYSSALIFKRECLEKLYKQNLFNKDFNIWKLYPQTYASFLIGILLGNVATLKNKKYFYREYEPIKNNKISELIQNYTPYFSDTARFQQCKEWIDVIQHTEKLSNIVKQKLLLTKAYSIVYDCFRYYKILHNHDMAIYKSYEGYIQKDIKYSKFYWILKGNKYKMQLIHICSPPPHQTLAKLLRFKFRAYIYFAKKQSSLLLHSIKFVLS